MMTAEQIVAAHKAQLATLHDMTSKALATVEKIAALNLQASKSALDDHAEQAKVLLSTKDVKDLVKLQRDALEPMAEKYAAYNRHLFEIASGLGEEFNSLIESQLADAQKLFMTAMEAALKNAPEGSEAGVALLKSAMSSATTSMEAVQKAFKEGQNVASNNLGAVVATADKSRRASKADAA